MPLNASTAKRTQPQAELLEQRVLERTTELQLAKEALAMCVFSECQEKN
jgi:hypothetical protein